jgi:tetratricopeptide (TPR) repeat protein
MEAGTPPSAGIYDFLGWFETNKKRIAIAAGALAVAGIIAGLYVWQRGQREIDAEQALSSVHMPFSPNEPLPPGTGDALAKIADEYSGTAAAPKAMLRAGTSYFAENKYGKAQEQFDKLLRNHGDTIWVPQAVYGIAATFEAQGKATEAINKYNEFIKNYPSDPAVDHAKLNVARLYEQTEQPALALDLLKKMTEGQTGYSPAASEAQERLKGLYAKHPELMPPPPVNPSMFNNVFSNVPPVQSTNVMALTNLLSRTNAAGKTGAAPKILLTPGTNNAGK